MRSLLILCIIGLVLGSFATVGCNSKTETGGSAGASVTKSNLEKIKAGMSVAQVQAIMGAGDTVQNASVRMERQRIFAEEHTWQNGSKSIVVDFVDGKVAKMSGLNL